MSDSNKTTICDDADQLLIWGLEPGEPIHVIEPEFTVEEILASLGSATPTARVIKLYSEHRLVELPIAVSHAELRYQHLDGQTDTYPVEAYPFPDWYIEGWVARSRVDRNTLLMTVRGYVQANRWSGMLERFYWQVIPAEPAGEFEVRAS